MECKERKEPSLMVSAVITVGIVVVAVAIVLGISLFAVWASKVSG